MMNGDEGVQNTNDDATACKLSAVKLGYWSDPYLSLMVKSGVKRAPEIHLGYYARVTGFRYLIDKFFDACDTKVQMINLGAGFDTLYWKLIGEGKPVKNFIEVDFSGVTARKCYLIKRHKELLAQVADSEGEVRLSKTDLHGNRYHLVAADFSNKENLKEKLEESEVDYQCPTLVMAECALVYADSAKVDQMLEFLSSSFSSIAFINYEQLNMNDRFGSVMLENLMSRGCQLSGVSACKDSSAQISRFTRAGWGTATCWNMNEVYSLLPQQDIQRVERIEFLDEKELLQQLFHHYCITVARKNSPNFNFDSINFD
ncbi:leucine carboxyl methyltransferase 1 [Eurytemora carolleeae]|uniref:leucine carboxyl methyltransferase 1 n=1 Tax=Eurytemora carolleeae TaxID=1294199 RepID=UPI000C78E5A9|nr:leucine carboxyl methyltransferase 1 [Eurytemora carolleeae]XP_023338768.1 leucine carboxyl methyltransferase 1 [Eurytemora carolleeae]|eukprot:XP_023325920.1 leucine carboxyl methyltransferase 1-like [Eurytemora affinis]